MLRRVACQMMYREPGSKGRLHLLQLLIVHPSGSAYIFALGLCQLNADLAPLPITLALKLGQVRKHGHDHAARRRTRVNAQVEGNEAHVVCTEVGNELKQVAVLRPKHESRFTVTVSPGRSMASILSSSGRLVVVPNIFA